MIKVENRNIFGWILILLSAWLIFSVSFGAIFGLYVGLKIAGPIAVEQSKSNDIDKVQNKTDITADQKKYIEKKTIEKMQTVNWWMWWPLLSTLAWLITSIFLGFMKVVKYNEGLVIINYINSFILHGKERMPPGNIFIEALTILLALAAIHFVSRWMFSKRMQA